eukprot:CAMPEP_0202896696 /NCGR_PEP_ID=MMETSP1392-20130828/5645_1 /ASSEMBLY_ACC=CAM_ASM_000868 /TAXON_ID=225041 /ORGANISM="Chlamydomonas chlamydogama, Strain SAG 11-48b" /LENGTH=226 /DNA_ID=CAMNT_0049582139 /DNA_START=48 /DNA_END=725 /DNA_ORIENTATION=-
MGRPAPSGVYKVDMSHQEMERLLAELEAWYESAGCDWITAEAAAGWLKHDLGYDDMDEFEDALNGTFAEFLNAMPHIETKVDEKGRLVFRVKPEPPQEEWRPVKMSLRIADREDLWNVCYKSPYARVEIPELEFEISPDGKKRTDSIYNHIAGAAFNLGTHVRGGAMPEEHRAKIMECCTQLHELLDLNTPWTWVLHDPSGLSQFQDTGKVVIEQLSLCPSAPPHN